MPETDRVKGLGSKPYTMNFKAWLDLCLGAGAAVPGPNPETAQQCLLCCWAASTVGQLLFEQGPMAMQGAAGDDGGGRPRIPDPVLVACCFQDSRPDDSPCRSAAVDGGSSHLHAPLFVLALVPLSPRPPDLTATHAGLPLWMVVVATYLSQHPSIHMSQTPSIPMS